MNKLMPTALTLAISSALITPTYAQQNTINDNEQEIEKIEVIGQLSYYSATKSNTPIMETARSVSVETIDQFLEKGALVLDDTFNYTSGVAGETFGFATRGDWLAVRGLSVPQYQDSLQSLFGNYNNTRPEIYTLEQVEILKGPASVLYGKGSPGGILNVVSKRPKIESHHEVFFELGNFNRKQFGFDSTGSIDDNSNWLYRMVGVYRDTDTQVNHVSDKTIVLAPSITWQPNDQSEVTMLINYTKSDGDTAAQFLPLYGTLLPAPNGKKINSNLYAGEPDFNKYKPTTLAVTLIAEQELNDNWTASITSRYTNASADYQQAWISFATSPTRFITLPDGSLYKNGLSPRTFYRNDATSKQKAVDIRLRGEFALGNTQHNLLFGTQYQDVKTTNKGYTAWALGLLDPATGAPNFPFQDQTWLSPFNPVYGQIPDTTYQTLNSLTKETSKLSSKDIGIYLSDQISIDQWRITLGLRYDNNKTKEQLSGRQQKDNQLSFSGGVLYRFDNGLSPYVSYAESFNPIIQDNNAPGAQNKPLKPELGKQTEIGIKYEPEALPGFISLAYFDLDQTNLVDPNTAPGAIKIQNAEVNIEGLELEGILDFGSISWEFNAHKLDTKSANGYRLAAIPEKQMSHWLTYQPEQLSGFKTGIGVRYVGENYGGGQDTIKTPSRTLVDMMLGYQIEHWDFTLNIRNLTNKEYYATCLNRGDCFPGDERTIVGRVKYVF